MTRLIAALLIAACSLPQLAGCGAATGVAPVPRVKTPVTKPGAKAVTPTKPTAVTPPAAPNTPGTARAFITQNGAGAPTFSPNGDRLVFETAQGLMMAQPNGVAPMPLSGTRPEDRAPAYSADGQAIAFVRRNGDASAIMRFAPATGQTGRVYEAPGTIQSLAWAPDGRSIVFVTAEEKKATLFRLPLPGGTPAKLWQGASAGSVTVTATGQVITDVQGDTGAWSLVSLSLNGGTPQTLMVSGTNPRYPRVSASGKSLAYTADDGLYVAQINGGNAQRVASGDGLATPAWHPKLAQIVVAAPRGSRPDLQIVELPKR